jgi:aryl-alcohol dehydrogenase-like predicted oxidoreductase
MNNRRLGASGLAVSPICLGSMMFGGRTAEKAAIKIINHARSVGINFIDTADVYNDGESERVVGKGIKAHRDDWVLATKVCNPMGDGPNRRGLGRKWIMQACNESLARLGTDYIDVYYFHKDDEETQLEESLEAVGDLIKAGKVRYYAVSNYYGWRLTLLCTTATNMGLPLPVACQPYYNAMTREAERDVLPACDYYALGVVPYSPLARGVLTAKYAPGSDPEKGSRAGSGDKRMLATEWRQESLELARKVKKHAAKKGMTAADWAVNWVLANPVVTSVLAGPRTMQQWKGYLGALDHQDKWSADDERFWNTLVSPGHPSTPGYNDPQYPIRGRPV